MTDEMHQDLMCLLHKYCGSQYQYNWNDHENGEFHMNLTFRLKNEYRKKGTTTNDETIT